MLHSDVLLVMEFNVDASRPFLLPHVRECFAFHSTIMDCNDTLCTLRPQRQTTHAVPGAFTGGRATAGHCKSRGEQGLAETTHVYCPMDYPKKEEHRPIQRPRGSKKHSLSGGFPVSSRVQGIQVPGQASGAGQREDCLALGLPESGNGDNRGSSMGDWGMRSLTSCCTSHMSYRWSGLFF